MRATSKAWRLSLVAGACVLALSACNSDSDPVNPQPVNPPAPPTGGGQPQLPTPVSVTAFSEGEVSADIRWAEYGVPYITSDSLQGIAFGSGYAFARDNACIIADQIVRFNGERARFFGPHVQGTDNLNLVNDFAYKALDLRGNVEAALDTFSDQTRALLQGYAAGYNKFITERAADVPLPCRGQPWMREVTEVDLMTYAQGVALLPGTANLIEAMFAAVPPGESFAPEMVSTELPLEYDYSFDGTRIANMSMPDTNPTEMGSNGWGLGADFTGSSGMLLANPHFPHSGNQRFWQSGIEIPGELKVVGGSLSGFPGLINIGFNENVAWTHTFSTAQRFVVYQLELDPADDRGLSYLVDGESQEMESRRVEVEVNVGGGNTVTFARDFYFSSFGPMISIPGNFEWGQNFQGQTSAFAIFDANYPNFDVVDHWLALNTARDIDDVEASFYRHTGLIFNNIMATDRDGDVFFTDGSSVPDLSPATLNRLVDDPVLLATRLQAPFFLVPGNSAEFRARGTVPFERAPQLRGTDSVQNSNDSYWLTNANSPITGDFLLYGRVNNQQTLRSRMGQVKLAELREAGSLDLSMLENALISNRAFLGEAVVEDLVEFCTERGTTPVTTTNGDVDISAGCNALAQWNGTMNTDSVGALVLREFAQRFATNPQWQVAFNPADPINTPNTLARTNTTLVHLANAIRTIEQAGLAVDAPFGEVQFVERSLPNGQASGTKLPWGGANNIEGGFNVFARQGAQDGTLLPRHLYPTISGSQLSAEGEGYHITSGSSWMFVMQFTEQGPEARGLLTYSQSSDVESPHFLDQTLFYSAEPRLRDIPFSNDDIADATIESLSITMEVEQD
ncbi:MAG: penicillin acylase family protein [Firmicutes bacterium]|nr:penicillin acylase family protein [Bacillota bacterium]